MAEHVFEPRTGCVSENYISVLLLTKDLAEVHSERRLSIRYTTSTSKGSRLLFSQFGMTCRYSGLTFALKLQQAPSPVVNPL